MENKLSDEAMTKRIEVMRDFIELQIKLNLVMNKMIANSYYFDCNTMNNWAKAITEVDKATSSLDWYIERIIANE